MSARWASSSAGSSRSTSSQRPSRQQRELALAQSLARAKCPLLVALVGQQLTAIGGIVAALEAFDVGRHPAAGRARRPRRATRPRRGRRVRCARSSRPCAGWPQPRRRRAAARASRAPRHAACGDRERARAASPDPRAPLRPGIGRDWSRVDQHFEASEQPDLELPHTNPTYRRGYDRSCLRHETRFCTSPTALGSHMRSRRGHAAREGGQLDDYLDYDRQSPVWRHWVRELSRGHTLIRHDERGCGLSDRQFDGLPTLDTYVGDLAAVVDAAGSIASRCWAYPAAGRPRSSTRPGIPSA